jgi:hypothetical protein
LLLQAGDFFAHPFSAALWAFMLGLLGSTTRRKRDFFLTAATSFDKEGKRSRCAFACETPFRKQEQHAPQTRTQLGVGSSQSDRWCRQGGGDFFFPVRFCAPGAGKILYYIREIYWLRFFLACFQGDQSGRVV